MHLMRNPHDVSYSIFYSIYLEILCALRHVAHVVPNNCVCSDLILKEVRVAIIHLQRGQDLCHTSVVMEWEKPT